MTAIKHDNEKPRMDLLDPDFLEGVAKVLTFGARKYSPHNWRNGFDYSRIIASLYRHLTAFQRGEDCDAESGQSHLYHIGCNAMFLAAIQNEHPELDDRYKGKQNVHSTALNINNISAALSGCVTPPEILQQISKNSNDSLSPGAGNILGRSPPGFCEHGEQSMGSVRDVAPIKTRCVTDGL